MFYEIISDPARMDVDIVWGYLRRSYWSPNIRREIVAKAVANSLCVGAFEVSTGNQVGFARVVSDRATFAWLCDVFVLEEHRGKNLSKRMVESLLRHPDLQTLRRWSLGTRDAHGLYKQFGFTPADPERGMELRLDPRVWSEQSVVSR